jgi:CubicO group peptidase (beta-lactamase class C family)
MRIHLFFFVLACSSIACSQADRPPSPDFSALRSRLLSQVGKDNVPGLAVAVSRDGETLWEETFGWADRESQVAATVQTPFFIASISKTFTATAVLHLAELGRLQIDDPVNKYLNREKIHSPRWNVEEATIRRLMTHTSGLTTFTRWCASAADARCDIHNEIGQYGVLVWPPGKVFDYSNLGYGILGQVVAKASSQRFYSYLRSTIFQPLHMQNCGIALGASASKPVAASYNEDTHARSPSRVSGHEGASGLYCSAHDLLLFGSFNLKQNLDPASPLNSQDIDQMHSAQPGTGGNYGFGWWIRKDAGLDIVSAQGGTTDAYALLELVPAKGIVIVVVANSYSPLVSGLERQILSAIVPGSSHESPPSRSTAPQRSPAPDSLAGKWTGQILTPQASIPVTMDISREGTARVQLANLPVTTLTNISLEPDHLYGELSGRPGLPDSFDHPFTITLDLALHSGELTGAATFGPLAGEDGDQLPHFVTLARTKS